MVRRTISILIVLMFSLGPIVQATGIQDDQLETYLDVPLVDDVSSQDLPDILPSTTILGNHFISNSGQMDEGAGQFYVIGEELSVGFGSRGVSYRYTPSGSDRGFLYIVNHVGSNDVDPAGVEPLDFRSNYFIGNDPARWRTGVRSYSEIWYYDIYDGMDLRYYFGDDGLKYDFRAWPGSDPSSILMHYEGIDRLELDGASRDLIVHTPLGAIRDRHPVTYQDGPRGREVIPSDYVITDTGHVAFDIGVYDRDRPLVIDPEMLFSSYLGGKSVDARSTTHVDDKGFIYMAGSTSSTDFPVTTGAYDTSLNLEDAFLLKLKPSGAELVYATFLGGSSSDECSGLFVESDGNVTVCGSTESINLPTRVSSYQTFHAGGRYDGFIAKLTANGSKLAMCTYIGGRSEEALWGIYLDQNGSIYAAGSTDSDDLPVPIGSYDHTPNGGYDAMVMKMDPNGTRLLNLTYFGGSSDEGAILAHDSSYRPIIYSRTDSTDIPTSAGAFQNSTVATFTTYVTKFDTDLSSMVFSTYLGGTGGEIPAGMVVDENDNMVIGGTTYSRDYHVTPDAYDNTYNGGSDDGFITILNASGDKVTYSTFLGGSRVENGNPVYLAPDGTVHFALMTKSDGLYVTPDALEPNYNRYEWDLYYGILNITNRSLDYASYYGGSKGEVGMYVHFGNGNLTCVGWTESDDLATTKGALYESYQGTADIFIFRVCFLDIVKEPPGPPANLTAEAGDGSVTLRWEEPGEFNIFPVLGYHVFMGDVEDVPSLSITADLDRRIRNQTMMFLENGKVQYFTVRAFNTYGNGTMSAIVNATPAGLPAKPRDLTLTPGNMNVTIGWSSPSTDGGMPVLGYWLFRGHQPQDLEPLEDVGNETGHIDEGLENGILYFYSALAYNVAGNGTMATPLSVVPYGLPSEPRNIGIVGSYGKVRITWTYPEFDGGRSVLGYKVLRGTSIDTLDVIADVSGNNLTHDDVHVANGVEYFYCVVAYNQLGLGSRSDVLSVVPMGRPSVPRDLRTESGGGFVVLSWGPPADPGGSPVLGYGLHRGETLERMEWLANVSDTSYNDTAVENGTEYWYVVVAFNEVGDGPFTYGVMALPMGFPSEPRDLRVVPGLHRLTIEWTAPLSDGGVPVERYIVYRGDSPSTLESFLEVDGLRNSIIDEGLTAGTTYHYAVVAATFAGRGDMSETVPGIPYGLPGPPLHVEATAGDARVSISWAPPDDDGGHPIVGYSVLMGRSEDAMVVIVNVLAPDTDYIDFAVVNGRVYHYAVRAETDAGTGPASSTVTAQPVEPPSAPGEVSSVDVTLDGVNAVITWSIPDDDGGSPITGYLIMRGPSQDNLSTVGEVGPDVDTYSDEGLERGRKFYYTVVAKNAEGLGGQPTPVDVLVEKKDEPSEGLPGFEVVVVCLGLLVALVVERRRSSG